jgi:hypothetical protein
MCSRTGTRHGIKWRDMLAQAVHLREGEHGNRPILIVFLYHSISVSNHYTGGGKRWLKIP